MVLAVGSCEDRIDAWERKERAHSRKQTSSSSFPLQALVSRELVPLRSKAWQGGGAWQTAQCMGSSPETKKLLRSSLVQLTAEPHRQGEGMEQLTQNRNRGASREAVLHVEALARKRKKGLPLLHSQGSRLT